MIDKEKKQVRKQVRLLKSEVSLEQKKARSKSILQNLENHPQFINAQTIMMYWSMADEVYTHEFVCKWAQKKKIILPCVNGDKLLLKEFFGPDSLVSGENFGIPEPDGPVFSRPGEIEMIVVPGVAFDKSCNRLGRGRAYYDKLLNSVNAVKVGICFDFQLLDKVPVDKYDIKMDMVIGES